VFIDPDKDIGGPNPILADEDFEGDGYESQIELEDSELAYASMLPGHSNIIQIAFSRDLLENANEFLWGAWADKGVNDPGAFDYNDRFNAEQAGSPLKDDANYPLAALFNVDNTCRQPFGFTPQSNIPGSCMVIPQATASETEGNGKSPFCCPTINIGGCCSFPESCGPDDAPPPPPPPDEDEEDDEPAAPAEPVECTPRQSAQPGECDLELEAQVECDGVNDIILISTTGAGFTALTGSSPDFTCSTADDTLTCTGAKQDAGTPLTVEVCGSIVPDRVPNCKDYPDTFWVENLGICLPLGSSCCQIGQEWLADEARCVPIVSGDGDANQEICGDAYVLVNGYCVFKSSLDTCCTNVEIEAPCCYFACVPGYVLDPVTRCCNKAPAPAPQEAPKPKDDPCAGVVCDRCCIAHNCPSGCCSCRQ
jgi:hypothetical protein